ncbi:hypothetical protein [Kitasatospora sp. LaBMicrA B282]|uniref:hypothetical protein n=1 Tax=Kitasatospora sp. LaBMicrA B282 TaxID=3420949 RepID=UPI003D152A13
MPSSRATARHGRPAPQTTSSETAKPRAFSTALSAAFSAACAARPVPPSGRTRTTTSRRAGRMVARSA